VAPVAGGGRRGGSGGGGGQGGGGGGQVNRLGAGRPGDFFCFVKLSSPRARWASR
jgi:hypothetical protein